MRRATIIVVSMALGAALSAWAVAGHYARELERVRSERQPAPRQAHITDDQLMTFWFGDSADPVRLRDRACGRRPRK